MSKPFRMIHRVAAGESPAMIARRYGLPVRTLMEANPHKPIKRVGVVQTWNSLFAREPISIPVASAAHGAAARMSGAVYGLGDPATDAVRALVAAGGPCLQANVGYVCAVQQALGVTVDGKYGSGTAAAARVFVPNAPPACSPAPLWWGKRGENKCIGVPVPSIPIPAIPIPAMPAPIPSIPTTPLPSVAAAVQALASIDPCLSTNAPMVCAAQAALGLTVDGKYGAGTAAAVRALVPGAPAGCSPAPLWWGRRGESKCGGVAPQPLPISPPPLAPMPVPSPVAPLPPPPPAPMPPPPPLAPVVVSTPTAPLPPLAPTAPQPPAPVSPGAISPVGPMQPVVVAPEKKPLSTGAIVAGAVGVAALVGLIAVAASGKRSTTTTKTTTIRRAPAKRKAKRKPAKRKSAARKKGKR